MGVIVLLFTFGTVVAMGLPIVTAIFGLVCGLSIVTLLATLDIYLGQQDNSVMPESTDARVGAAFGVVAAVFEKGWGATLAVAVDATLVRCLLVPAAMVLIGRANWWFPRWLDRVVPNFSIEGEEYFRALDARTAAATADEKPAPPPAVVP